MVTYREILYRLGYYRTKNKLSLRDTCFKLDMNEKHFGRVESGEVALKVEVLLKFLELVNVSPTEFFYPKPENYQKDKEIFDAIQKLSADDKDAILNLVNKLNKSSK